MSDKSWATVGGAQIVEPPAAKKTQGWNAGEPAAAEYMNWWMQKMNDEKVDKFGSQSMEGPLTLNAGDLIIDRSGDASTASLLIKADTGFTGLIQYSTGSVARWQVIKDTAAESGGNVGSDYLINARDDAGVLIGTAFKLTRASMAAEFGGSVGIGRAPTAKFDVHDTVGVAIILERTGGSTGRIVSTIAGNNAYTEFKDNGDDSFTIGIVGNVFAIADDVDLADSGNFTFSISGATGDAQFYNQVGIGRAPTALFDVFQAAGNGNLVFILDNEGIVDGDFGTVHLQNDANNVARFGMFSSTSTGSLFGLSEANLTFLVSLSGTGLAIGTQGASDLVLGTGNTARMLFAGVSADIFVDAQMTFQSEAGIVLEDDIALFLGDSGQDLKLYSDGVDVFMEILGTTKDLFIRADSSLVDVIVVRNGTVDSRVELYHDGNIRLETTLTGVAITGSVLQVDTIDEKTTDAGVIVEGTRLENFNIIVGNGTVVTGDSNRSVIFAEDDTSESHLVVMNEGLVKAHILPGWSADEDVNIGGSLPDAADFSNTGPFSTAQVLKTFTLPAGMLTRDGQVLRVTGWGVKGGANGAATIKFRVNGVIVIALSTTSASGRAWYFEALVSRVSPTAFDVVCWAWESGDVITVAASNIGNEGIVEQQGQSATWSGAIVIDYDLTLVNASDTVTQTGMLVELVN